MMFELEPELFCQLCENELDINQDAVVIISDTASNGVMFLTYYHFNCYIEHMAEKAECQSQSSVPIARDESETPTES